MTREPQPGDLVLAHSRGLFGRLIRIGEAFHWRPGRKWNHAAIVVSNGPGGVEVVQMSRRCVRIPLSEVAPGGQVQVRPCPKGVNPVFAVRYALAQLGTAYGVLTILCIAVNLLTPQFLRIDFRRPGTLICSGLVARSYEHGAWSCPYDPFQISPAQLAECIPEGT